MTTRLLIHADRAPDFVEFDSAAPILYGGPSGEGVITYEDTGKLRVPLEVDEEGAAVSFALVRMFVHPDLLAEIRERGDRLDLSGY